MNNTAQPETTTQVEPEMTTKKVPEPEVTTKKLPEPEETPTWVVTKAPIPVQAEVEIKTTEKPRFYVYNIPTAMPKKFHLNPEQFSEMVRRPKPSYQPEGYHGMTGER